MWKEVASVIRDECETSVRMRIFNRLLGGRNPYFQTPEMRQGVEENKEVVNE
jgi:hypothetical protein